AALQRRGTARRWKLWCRLRLLADGRPLAILGARQDGVANPLRFQGVAERRADRFALGDPFQEVGDLVDEAVLVADRQPRHPPLVHVGMVAVGDVDRAPAAERAFVAMV